MSARLPGGARRDGWWADLEADRLTFVLAASALVGLALVDALSPLIMVSTLGIVVVVSGLFALPRTVVVLSGLAIVLALALVVTQHRTTLSPLRVGNVVIGSVIAVASSAARQHRLRDIERLRRRDAALLRSIGDGIVGVDGQARITFVNPAAQDLLGVADADARGRLLTEALGVDPGGAGAQLLEAVRAADPPALPADLVVGNAAGERIPVEYVVEPLDDGEGAVISFRDVTARLAAAQDRERLLRLEVSEQEYRRVLGALEQALRPVPPVLPGATLDVTYLPADEHAPTGGDLYDVEILPDGTVHLLVVDVVGHDIASVRDALRVAHLARALTLTGVATGDLVERLDSLLAQESLMATLVVARYEPGTGHVRVVSGGHPPPLLLRAGGDVEWLEGEGRPLGFPLAGTDDVVERELAPGDLLVLYTDGLVEAKRDITAGLADLAHHARDLRALPIDGWTSRLTDCQLRGATRKDDTLTLALRREAGAGTGGEVAAGEAARAVPGG